MSTPRVRVLADVDAVGAAAAEHTAEVLRAAVAARGRARLSATGGTAGLRCAAALAGQEVPWGAVDLYFGDERFVPANDSDRNDGQWDRALLQGLRGEAPRVQRWPARSPELDDVDAAARDFADRHPELVAAEPTFDVHLLGVGGEGHVNSVFPDSPAVRSSEFVVGVRDCPKPPPERMTFTLPLVRRSRHVLLVVAGPDKAGAVARALAPGADQADVPATGCRGLDETLWLVDEAAAAELPR